MRPRGVEDLVPAVLGVGLREHHQLDVGRIAAEFGVALAQVVDLVLRQRQAEARVGARRASASGTRFERRRARGAANSAARVVAARRAATASSGRAAQRASAGQRGRHRRGQPARSRRRPRSTRFTGRPAPCRISVALLAQGEIVPRRGSHEARDGAVGARRLRSARPSRMRRRASRRRVRSRLAGSTQIDVPGAGDAERGNERRRRASRRSRRNGDRAGRPSRTIMSGRNRGKRAPAF